MTNRLRDRGNIYKIILGVALVVVIGFFFFKPAGKNGSSSSDQKLEVKAPSATSEVNKNFSFPLKDSKGVEVAKVEFQITKAELRDEIIVKGKKASSVKGRTFLVFNLNIKNSYHREIQIDSRDYVRLSVNGDEENWLAPDIHNDPITVQPISTKQTRIGFPINETDGKFVLQVGEIQSDKEKIEINF